MKMNRNLKTALLSTVAVLALGTAGMCFAAEKGATLPQTVKQTTVKTTASTTKTAPKISQEQATQTALKAHPNAKLANIKLQGKAYIIHLTSDSGNYTLKIGANTGRILKDKQVKMTTTTNETSATKK